MSSQYTYPEKHNKTVRRYCDAILKLLRRTSVERVTVQMILDESETARSTYYSYFQDKYHLIYYVLYYKMETLLRDIFQDQNGFRRSVTSYFDFLKEHETFYRKVFTTEGPENFREYYIRMQRELLRRNIVERIGIDAYVQDKMEYYVVFYSSGMTSVVLDWVQTGCSYMTPAELTEFLFRYFPVEYFEK